MPEAVIIGAGPAGSIAGLILARAGWNITIVEQHRFPRNKVCGECLSALGISVLERLGMRDTIGARAIPSPGTPGEGEGGGDPSVSAPSPALPRSTEGGGQKYPPIARSAHRLGLRDSFGTFSPATLHRVCLHPSNGNSLQIELPKPMWGISRSRLDRYLLDQAVRAGDQLLQPCRYEGIEGSDSQSLRVKLRDLEANEIRTIETPWLIIADGKSTFSSRGRSSSSDLGIKCHWSGIVGPCDAIELFGCHGAYGGLAPIENGRWNAAFSVPTVMARKSGGDLQQVFERLLADNPAMQLRFAGARRIGDWLASPLPRFAVRRDWPTRTILLGNAVAAIEPIGGEGMGLAMRSAEIAAEMMIHAKGVWNARIAAELQRRFMSLWQVRLLACRAGGVVASSPRLAKVVSPWLRHNRPVAQAVLNWAGK